MSEQGYSDYRPLNELPLEPGMVVQFEMTGNAAWVSRGSTDPAMSLTWDDLSKAGPEMLPEIATLSARIIFWGAVR